MAERRGNHRRANHQLLVLVTPTFQPFTGSDRFNKTWRSFTPFQWQSLATTVGMNNADCIILHDGRFPKDLDLL
jgi:hypothetical protein